MIKDKIITQPTKNVNTRDLLHFVLEKEVTYASHYGNGNDRKLNVTLNGFFKVYKGKDVVLTTRMTKAAVDKYNSLEVIKDGKDS